MDMLYKTNMGVLIRYSIASMGITMLIVLGVMLRLMEVDPFKLLQENPLAPMWLLSYGATLAVGCLFFMRNNKTVRITQDGVTFSRGKKVYMTLPRSEYFFSSHIYEMISFGIPPMTSRYLLAIHKGSQKKKKYRLYFSGKKFDRFIASVEALNEES